MVVGVLHYPRLFRRLFFDDVRPERDEGRSGEPPKQKKLDHQLPSPEFLPQFGSGLKCTILCSKKHLCWCVSDRVTAAGRTFGGAVG